MHKGGKAMAKIDSASIRSQINRRNISNADLLAIYRRVAKTADQRLVRLEALNGKKNFKNVKRYAYKNATMDALQWGANPDKPRFNIKPPLNSKARGKLEDMISRTSIRAKINDMLNFIEKPTSTKEGIISVYQKRADTLNKNKSVIEAGLHFTWQDVGDFFDSSLYKKVKPFGSGTKIEAIGTLKKNKTEILKAFKADSKNHIKTVDDPKSAVGKIIDKINADDIVVDEAINKMLSEYGADVRKLLKIL